MLFNRSSLNSLSCNACLMPGRQPHRRNTKIDRARLVLCFSSDLHRARNSECLIRVRCVPFYIVSCNRLTRQLLEQGGTTSQRSPPLPQAPPLTPSIPPPVALPNAPNEPISLSAPRLRVFITF